MNILVKKVSTSEEIKRCLAIRQKVFVIGQNVPIDEEVDGKDEASHHYLLFVDNHAVGVARVRYVDDFAKIERVAILDEYQGKGLGKRIMEGVLTDIKKNGGALIAKLSAQTYAISFYEKLGFSLCGEEYLDAGILHRDMKLVFE